MENEAQDDLFDLIHCLDPAEKAHFSRFAQRHVLKDGNNYEQLFQLMSKMPAYDAQFIAAELKRLGIATPLPAAKNHLKSIILRAMRDFNSGRSTHSKLLEGLENLAFFYEKKQFDLLRKEIKRLKKIAQLYSEHHILFKIGDYERKLHKATARRDLVEGMEEILSEMQLQAKAFQNQLQFGHLLEKFFVIANKSSADRDQAINALLTTELLASEENAITPMARIYYHQIHAIALMVKCQYPEAQRKYGAVLSLWEAAPHLIAETPSTYRRAIGNYLQICGITGDYSKYETMLDQIRKSPAVQLPDKAEVFSIGYNSELLWRLQANDWEGVANMIPSLEDGLKKYGDLIPHSLIIAFQYHIVVYYFLSQDDAACRQWLREITEAPRNEQRMDIQRIAKVMHLLLLWRKRELELLEYEYRSVSRYFENWGTGDLETHVMNLIQALLLAQNNEMQKAAFGDFIARINAPEFLVRLGGSVLLAWAIGQTSGELPQQVIKRQAENGIRKSS